MKLFFFFIVLSSSLQAAASSVREQRCLNNIFNCKNIITTKGLSAKLLGGNCYEFLLFNFPITLPMASMYRGERIVYWNSYELAQKQVFLVNGLFYDSQRQLVNTPETSISFDTGMMLVMDE